MMVAGVADTAGKLAVEALVDTVEMAVLGVLVAAPEAPVAVEEAAVLLLVLAAAV